MLGVQKKSMRTRVSLRGFRRELGAEKVKEKREDILEQ